ncbi:MAG: TIGR04282 family arsenosugar biosynthesis glycosyltransferase [Flavobacteriaceae bacterium]
MTQSKNLILIFTRNPELGKCKTRLAKTIGDKNALTIYKMLLQHTADVVEQLNCDKAVYYSVRVRTNDIWDDSIYQKHQQHGADLGYRMQNAFKESFKAGYEKVIIVGSDLYDLKPKHIQDAFNRLDSNDVVIGPAEDGGYYLLGMTTLLPNIFENKNWGTDTVRTATLNNLKTKKVALLETLNDIDFYDDVKDYAIFKPYLNN